MNIKRTIRAGSQVVVLFSLLVATVLVGNSIGNKDVVASGNGMKYVTSGPCVGNYIQEDANSSTHRECIVVEGIPSDYSARSAGMYEQMELIGEEDSQYGNGDSPESALAISGLGDVKGRSLPCIGNGSTGPRVQMLYAYLDGNPNRLPDLLNGFISIAKRTNGVYYNSTHGNRTPQKIKFLTKPDCTLKVKAVKVPSNVSNFQDVVDAVKAAGYDKTNRKYLIELDADLFCGVGLIMSDDSPGNSNLNNKGVSMHSVVGKGCWDAAEPHEIGHNLGAVQNSAPRTTGGYHCNDDWDVMCYDDGGPSSNLKIKCNNPDRDWELDCGHNDYYDNDPTPDHWYLRNHWNIADSRYLTNSP